jgi:iduronate 2-sulfatase
MIHDPRAAANGATVTAPVQAMDIYPTLCELCNLPLPAGQEGHSLTPLLRRADAPWDHPAISVFGARVDQLGVAIRTHKFRYVEYDRGEAGVMLFDVVDDPHEQVNRANDPHLKSERDRLALLAREVLERIPPAKP